MQPLEPPDTHYLIHAVGWIELGNLAEAKVELAQIRTAFQKHPNEREVRWQIFAEEKQWEEALGVARQLIQAAPNRPTGWLHQAYALRRSRDGGLRQAWEALLSAYEKFPRTELIAYNLSCYACQMHELDAARLWLKRALSIGDKDHIKQRAMEDADLEPLWSEIREY